MHLLFPFLIAETKGLSTGLIDAQNQAASSGASALNIHTRLHDFITSEIPAHPINSLPCHPQLFVFTITTEGPVHELWVNYRDGDEFHMTHQGVWRPTGEKDALVFVERLARIMHWGLGVYREVVLQNVKQIELIDRERLKKILSDPPGSCCMK